MPTNPLDKSLRKYQRRRKIFFTLALATVVWWYYIYVELISDRDITKRFANLTNMEWCTTKDVFIVSEHGGQYVSFGLGDVPLTVDEYEKHPNNWWEFPPYTDSPLADIASHSDITAAIRSGSHFKIIRIIVNHNFEAGVSLSPIIAFDGKLQNFSEISGSLLLKNSFDTTTLAMKAAKICQ